MSPNGTIVGSRTSDGVPVIRTPDGTETVLGDASFAPTAVNDNGVVVGRVGNEGELLVGGQLVPLSALLPDGWSVIQPFDVNDNGDIIGAAFVDGVVHGWVLQRKQSLDITSVTIDPTQPSTNDTTVTGTINVRNDTPDTLTGVTATVSSNTPALASITSPPAPSSVTLAPGASTDFTFTASPLAEGTASLAITASGSDGGTTVNAKSRTRTFVISPAGLTMQLSASPNSPAPGVVATITATVTNTGTDAVTDVTPALTGTPADTLTIGAPSPAADATLAAGATTTFTWSVAASTAATYTMNGSLDWTDPTAGPQRKTATLQLEVADHGIVVNTTGDEDLTSTASDHRLCDSDDDTSGNQCTLRAAITLANLLGSEGDTELISFAISDPGIPQISPATALPSVTARVTLDATTQAGGLVELSGASADGSNGLTLEGGNSTVRGFVLNGWHAALVLGGRAADTVVGNLIGTDVTGATAVANQVGISLHNNGDRIGALTSNGQLVCSGDCNVISGNTTAGITNNDQTDAFVPSRNQIVGNVIGTDVGGTLAIPNGYGVGIFRPSAAAPADTDLNQIGEATTRPGLAPGNLISGNTDAGIETGVTGGADAAAADTLIRGNLVGATWGGTEAMGGQPVGIDARVVNDMVGGPGASDANVVVGSSTAGITGGSIVQGNQVGLGLTGAAIPNAVGVAGSGATPTQRLCGNVISGNATGVSGTVIAGGNRIGTNAAGTAARPNTTGVLAPVTSIESTRCPATATDVISGNTAHGVLAFNADAVSLGNAYIGTDATGTTAIPNGIGLLTGGGELSLGFRAGETGQPLGECATPCVVVSGNTGAGVVVGKPQTDPPTSLVSVSRTFIGTGVGGQALGNGGAGVDIRSQMPEQASGGVVRGSFIDQSTIANNSGDGILLESEPATPPTNSGPFTISRNNIFANHVGVEMADGSGVTIFENTIFGNGTGVAVFGSTAPDVTQNSMYDNTTVQYAVATGVAAIGQVTSLAADRAGSVVTVTGDVPTGNALNYRVDVYADASCGPGSQGRYFLGSFDGNGLLSLTGQVMIPASVPGSVAAIEVTATDEDTVYPGGIDGVAGFLDGRTGRYTSCTTMTGTPPTATTSSDTVAPGGSLGVSGTGFAPGEPVSVTLHSDPVLLATATADATGAISTTVTIPSNTPPGAHTIVIEGKTSGVTASAALTVTAPAGSTTNPAPATTLAPAATLAPATTPAPATTDSTLAFTGSSVLRLALAGIGLLVLGLGLVLAARRRRIRPPT
jgi:parallel beta-helix repeat protein